MNRETVSVATAAGFSIVAIESVFLDIILALEALPTNVRFHRNEDGAAGIGWHAADSCGAPPTGADAL